MSLEIAYRFGFDAAHRLEHFPDEHPNRRLHGHSFQVEVTLQGERGPDGFVVEFGRVEEECARLRAQLDHRLLNDVAGLEVPTLENLAVWIWDKLAARLPQVARVTVRRDSCGQSCTYSGR